MTIIRSLLLSAKKASGDYEKRQRGSKGESNELRRRASKCGKVRWVRACVLCVCVCIVCIVCIVCVLCVCVFCVWPRAHVLIGAEMEEEKKRRKNVRHCGLMRLLDHLNAAALHVHNIHLSLAYMWRGMGRSTKASMSGWGSTRRGRSVGFYLPHPPEPTSRTAMISDAFVDMTAGLHSAEMVTLYSKAGRADAAALRDWRA